MEAREQFTYMLVEGGVGMVGNNRVTRLDGCVYEINEDPELLSCTLSSHI